MTAPALAAVTAFRHALYAACSHRADALRGYYFHTTHRAIRPGSRSSLAGPTNGLLNSASPTTVGRRRWMPGACAPERTAIASRSSSFAPSSYLAALPPAQPTVTLPFSDLDGILGMPLAVSAKVTSGYWTSSAIARRNWLAAGWTARLNRNEQTVTFTRQGS